MWRAKLISQVSVHTIIITILLFATGCSKTELEIIDDPIVSTTFKIPLNNPDIFTQNGVESGLYPWGNSLITNSYKTNYINACESIEPLNYFGANAGSGKVVVLTIGGSNPAIIYNGFINAQQSDPGFGSDLLFINGGINSQDFSNLLDPATNYWDNMQNLLTTNNVTENDVQVIFCIEDNLRYRDTSFQRAYLLRDDYVDLLEIIRDKYPNCKLFLAGDRGYSGYTDDPKHDEPIGYENGWAVKFLVADYINGLLPEYPVVNWLDYYWADGENPRWDGLTYSPTDYAAPAYVHFTQNKADELAGSTHAKLKTDPGASYWYK